MPPARTRSPLASHFMRARRASRARASLSSRIAASTQFGDGARTGRRPRISSRRADYLELVLPVPASRLSLLRSTAFSTLFFAVLASCLVIAVRYSVRESLPSPFLSASLNFFDNVGLPFASAREI